MKEIKIEGLTTEQCDMLDIMWDLRSSDDLGDWLDSLSDEELKQAMTLKELLIAHCIDEIDEIDVAKSYLKKFRL